MPGTASPNATAAVPNRGVLQRWLASSRATRRAVADQALPVPPMLGGHGRTAPRDLGAAVRRLGGCAEWASSDALNAATSTDSPRDSTSPLTNVSVSIDANGDCCRQLLRERFGPV